MLSAVQCHVVHIPILKKKVVPFCYNLLVASGLLYFKCYLIIVRVGLYIMQLLLFHCLFLVCDPW